MQETCYGHNLMTMYHALETNAWKLSSNELKRPCHTVTLRKMLAPFPQVPITPLKSIVLQGAYVTEYLAYSFLKLIKRLDY